MKHKTKITSLIAYEEVLSSLGKRQVQVLKALSNFYSATNMMIAEFLGWSINRVTPRVFELRKKRLIRQDKIGLCKITNRTAIYWRFLKR